MEDFKRAKKQGSKPRMVQLPDGSYSTKSAVSEQKETPVQSRARIQKNSENELVKFLKLQLPVISRKAGQLLLIVRQRFTKVRKTALAYWKNASRNQRIAAAGACGVIILLAIPFILSGNNNGSSPTGKKDGEGQKTLGESKQKPEFKVALPNGKESETDGGKVRYDGTRKTASFIDKVDNVSVTVTQQGLPDRFKTNQASELAEFAKEIYANESFEVGDTKVYAGESAKGPQTLVLIRDQTLVFITADKKIENSSWIQYIGSWK